MPNAAASSQRRTHAETSAPEAAAPAPAPADPRVLALLAMQQTAGNAAVARMLQAEREGAPVEPAASVDQAAAVALSPAGRGIQRGLWDDFTDAVGGAASAVGGAVSDAASAVGGAVTTAAGAVADVASAAWEGLSDAAKAAWGGIAGAGAFVGKWGMGVLSTFGDWVWDLVTEAPERIWRLLEHVGSGIVGRLSWIWGGVRGALGHAWDGLAGMVSWIGEGVSGMFNWVWTGLQRGEAWARRVLSGDFDALRDGFKGLVGWLGDGAKGLLDWGWEGVKGVAIWAAEGVGGVGKWMLDGVLSGAAWVGRFVAKCLDLVGFGEIADLLGQVLKGNTRPLSGPELAIAQGVFGGTVDYSQVRVDEHSMIAKIGAYFSDAEGMGVTLFHTINFNKRVTASPGSEDAGWLVHEMTHVWQYEHAGGQYLGEAIHAQVTTGYEYGPSKHWQDDRNGAFLAERRAHGATFASFNREQQGDITAHYYMRASNNKATVDWQPYIDDVRAGVG